MILSSDYFLPSLVLLVETKKLSDTFVDVDIMQNVAPHSPICESLPFIEIFAVY